MDADEFIKNNTWYGIHITSTESLAKKKDSFQNKMMFLGNVKEYGDFRIKSVLDEVLEVFQKTENDVDFIQYLKNKLTDNNP